MLQIRLNKGTSSEGGNGVRPSPVETVTVACPDHLVLADLPVAKCIGGSTAASRVKTVGRRSRRLLGERVHFCVQCDFPIAIYGRLSPCEHVFCLDCARSDSICYLCDERVQKIQTIKMMEGIFICAAPHCLKSFLKKNEFVSHMHSLHSDILPNAEKEDGNESEAQSAKQSAASESTARGPSRPINPSGSSSQLHDRDDKTRRQQPREQLPPRPVLQPRPPQYIGQVQNYSLEPRPENFQAQGFDRSGILSHFPQQGVDMQRVLQQEAGHQGIIVQTSAPANQLQNSQHPGFAAPVNQNSMVTPGPASGFPPYPTDGAQQFYGAPYEIQRQDSAPEVGSDQRSLLGFSPGPGSGANFTASYAQPWNAGSSGFPYEHGQNLGALHLSSPPPSLTSKGMEAMQGGNAMDPRDGKGILAPQLLHPPPPQPQPHAAQMQRAVYHSDDMVPDRQGQRWQHGSHDGFGSGQE